MKNMIEANLSSSEQPGTNKPVPMKKTTMSVPEMRELLGLKKTESYWLVHRGFFKTKIIGGQMRVDLESFEEWYRNQVKHKKINGENPGAELIKTSYSFQDAANLLGIHSATLYEIWKKENLETITVDFVRRIPIEVFENWYKNQIMYQKVDRMPCLVDLETDYIPLQQAADLLGITKEKLSVITRASRYKSVFEIRVFENKKWISKKSFQYFLNAQNVYQVPSNGEEKNSERNVLSIETKEFISRAEAAALAGVTTATITKWMQLEKFPCVGAGRILRIQRNEFLQWVETYRKGAV
jgi:predicted DNA-binding transcriptional regulator AlpA